MMSSPLRLFAIVAVAAVLGAPAWAHHGWSWADGEKTTLEGTIREISMAPPHPLLRVEAKDGTLWQVDLGNPSQTQRSGFSGETAKPGDAVTVLGNRSREPGAAHMKAVRITIDGKNYDMYPERID